MELRDAKLKTINAVSGGWEVAAAFLGMTVNALRNRAYEVKGQALTDNHVIALHGLCGETAYAEAIAQAFGGVFMKLPSDPVVDNVDLMQKFQDLYVELGTLSQQFKDAIKDDEIDRAEQAKLEQIAARIHKVLAELVKLMFLVYGHRPAAEVA